MSLSDNRAILAINWPPGIPSCVLDGISDAAEQRLYFDLQKGEISQALPVQEGDFLCFYWAEMTVIMENHCKQHVCLAEGKSIKTGHILTLKNGMTLQAGMFRLSITINDQDEDVCPTNFPGTDAELPELDDIILHGGQYIPWVESESHQDDILKRLAYEYKHFLLWGSSNQDLYDVDGKDENFLPERDVFLDGITERVKDKTIPECIFNDENLINIILDDLMSVAQEENMDDSPPDLLTALAPENMERIDTHPLPELLYRELYKLGLESPL